MINLPNLVRMVVPLTSYSSFRTQTVILPSVVAFWMAYTMAFSANMG